MKRITLFDCILVLIVGVMIVMMLYPFLYVISVSVSDTQRVANVTFYPLGFSTASYEYLLAMKNVTNGYLNSLLYTVSGTLVSLLLTTICAYPLSKKWLPGRNIITVFIVFTMYFSGGLIPSYLLVNNLHMSNSFLALIIPGAINTWYMILMRTYFIQNIPIELEESSNIDGANEYQIFTRVYLPLSIPIMATIALFYIVGQWNSWFAASIYLSDAGKYPIQLILRNALSVANSFVATNTSLALNSLIESGKVNVTSLNNALTVAVVAPIIILFPFVQKYFVKGIMVGSLKG